MLSDNIKNLRKKYNVKQEDLCNYFNVARGTVSMWETGKREPDYKTLIKLAKYFNVTVDYLLGNEDDYVVAEVQPQQTEQQKNCIDMIMQLDESLLDKAEIYLSGLSAREDVFTLKKLK